MSNVVLWYSRYEPLKEHMEHLKKIYGEDVKIVHTKRRFESNEQFLNHIKEINAKAVYAVLPLDRIDVLMHTEIGSKIDWLWAEYAELKDGVRSEEEKGFDADKDAAGYFFGMGQHRRFLGFSKIKEYRLIRVPLEDIPEMKYEGRKYLPRKEWKFAWKRSFEEMEEMIKKNRVLVKVMESRKYPDSYYVSVKFEKDTEMFEQLRPVLKERNFVFNDKHKDWNKVAKKEDIDEVLDEIRSAGNVAIENVAVRILMKNNLAEKNAGYLLEKSLEKTGDIVVVQQSVERSKSAGAENEFGDREPEI